MSLETALLLGSLITSGLMAGLFYAWRVSVIPGTRLVSDHAYVSTMQHINREIVNPAFVAPFVLTPLALGAAAVVSGRNGDARRAWLLGSAAITYTVGVLGVTIGGNIPLNDALDEFDLTSATDRTLHDRRTSYEFPWNRWHDLRTTAAVAAFGLASIAAAVGDG